MLIYSFKKSNNDLTKIGHKGQYSFSHPEQVLLNSIEYIPSGPSKVLQQFISLLTLPE